jgi:hypothetical protein
MLYHAILPLISAVIAGLGGLVHTLVYSDIVSALNSGRPPDAANPFAMTDFTLRDLEWSYGKVWAEFHREFPESKLYFSGFVGMGGMLLLRLSFALN